jgi:hypothetical protein
MESDSHIDKCYAYDVHIELLFICDLLRIYEDLLQEINYYYTIRRTNKD